MARSICGSHRRPIGPRQERPRNSCHCRRCAAAASLAAEDSIGNGISPRAAIAAIPAMLATMAMAHIARVTGLSRSRFTSDAVRTAPEPPRASGLARPQPGFLARMSGMARPNHSGKKSGHEKNVAHG
ncbi:MAG: hypothetical protein EBR10_05330 [Planctomycetes bacterium]|nr:hypothetical protein [Planctomycetota bacterium]